MSDHQPDLKEDVVTHIEEEVTEPPMYKVLLHNDNFTTKEFVVKILVAVFGKASRARHRLNASIALA